MYTLPYIKRYPSWSVTNKTETSRVEDWTWREGCCPPLSPDHPSAWPEGWQVELPPLLYTLTCEHCMSLLQLLPACRLLTSIYRLCLSHFNTPLAAQSLEPFLQEHWRFFVKSYNQHISVNLLEKILLLGFVQPRQILIYHEFNNQFRQLQCKMHINYEFIRLHQSFIIAWRLVGSVKSDRNWQ